MRCASRAPRSRWPSHTIVSTLRQASSPPRAATLRSMTSAAVLASARCPAGVAGSALAAAPAIQAPLISVTASQRILGLLGARRRERRELGFLEQRIAHRFVHSHPRNGHLVGLLHTLDRGLLQPRNGEPVFGLVVAKIDGDVVHAAVELAGLALYLEFEERAGIDPQVALLAIAQREFQFVGGVPFDRLGTGERDLRALGGEVDQRAIEILLRGGGFNFGRCVRLDFV